MKTIAWLSDIHLNFVKEETIIALANEINNTNADISLVTGDLSEFPYLYDHLDILKENLINPLYYVHGNHCFYFGSISEVQSQSFLYSSLSEGKIIWLGAAESPPIYLTDKTCLIGEDSWYDGRYGEFFRYPYFELADFDHIQDLKRIGGRSELLTKFNELGDQATSRLRFKIHEAAKTYENIICAMHVPPFAEAAVFGDGPSPVYSIPFFANKAMGEMLLDMKTQYKEKKITVLAGHSHYPAYLQIDNLAVHTAGAKYYHPSVYTIISVD